VSLSQRDRRAVALLGVAAVLALGFHFWPDSSEAGIVQAGASSIPMAEKRLARLRLIAAAVPSRTKQIEQIAAQLKERESRVLEAPTAAQAQAQMVQILTRLGRAQSPPVEIKQVEIGQVQQLGKDYGEALVSVHFTCTIEQLVNLLADLSAQPELLATYEIGMRAGDPKQKTITTRLTVSAVVPKALAPERKGITLF
jgi:flagellar motor switch/type III secretory pathway protein FliN